MKPSNDSSEIKFCPYCGQSLLANDRFANCSACGKSLKQTFYKPMFYRYVSPWTLFGWPLIHIESGMDPETKKVHWARGVIAIGSKAVGGLAIGGLTCGGITIGGCSLGMIGIGGCTIGLVAAFGGIAASLGLAIGGLAIGSLALGGTAIGFGAMGGLGIGSTVSSGNRRDFLPGDIADVWRVGDALRTRYLTPVLMFLLIAPFLFLPFLRKRSLNRNHADGKPVDNKQVDEHPTDFRKPPLGSEKRSMIGMLAIVLAGGVFGCSVLSLILVAVSSFF